ncbi:MAG: gamma-glutamyltransferase [Acidobacteriaceae bacterium]
MFSFDFRTTLHRSTACLLASTLFASTTAALAQTTPQTEKPVRTKHAMVVTIQHNATDAGVAILKEGGNAVDAAVAVGFALAVTYADAGNLGGGGFMLVHLKDGKNHFVDFREKAPLAATQDMYLDAKGNVIPHASTVGFRSIGVPGSVAGLVYAEKTYGKLTLKQVMAPAIKLATDGYVLTAEEAHVMQDKLLSQFPVSYRIFQRDGDFYKAGETFKQPLLAATLKRIANDPSDFYHGEIAKKLAAFVQKNGGLITEKDLASYQVRDRVPLIGHYHGYEFVTSPPPSSGGIALIEMFNMLDAYDLSKMGDRTPQEVHYIVEAFRRAYMDRTDYLGDPDFVKIPIQQMENPKYAAAFRASIDPVKPTPSKDLQRPAGFLPPPPKPLPDHHESQNTTHYSVLDANGNAVSVTYTLNNSFGSGVTAEGLGFVLNDEMDDFAAKQGVPNLYGLIQGPANAIAPGKRPLSSMTPTIVLKDGKVRMVLGSPGGSTIITTVANDFLSVVDGGLNIQQAVDAPHFHHQYLPDVVMVEPDFPTATADALKAVGYNVMYRKSTWGDSECIAVDPKTGQLEGGQDSRHHFGKAAGY